MNPRLLLSLLLPFLALAAQWLLWPWIKPFVWFLFFPTVFFSARLGGLRGGLASTVLSAGIVWYFFIPPQMSWAMENPNNFWSVLLFLIMGGLFSDTQERLRRAQESTAAALAQTRAANEKISRLYEKTLELDALKTQFFANVSHELRTPLTLILSPLARRLAQPGLPEDLRRESEMMLRNARLLYRQVSDLLDAAKLESGHMGVDYARSDLGLLTRLMGAHFASLAEEKGIAYRVEAPALEAEADAEKVQRILLNLLSNAFKFTPECGSIALTLRADGSDAVIEVADNGPGVPAELRAAVFERFRQVEGGSARHHGGTGLGLAIVKQFAELHGGSATVDEAPGGGARFAVRLPTRAPAGAVVHEEASRIDPVIDQQGVDELRATPLAVAAGDEGEAAALVLVVEDNPDMNAYIASALRPRYRVARAFDGRQGLEQARALRPDLILSDVMMPEMSGDQMVAALRPFLPDVPIVMLTARADDELRVRMLREGVQDYLAKPFAVDELLARVDGLVAARRRTLEELRRLNASLERRVAERTAELSAANRELDSFAYAVSHDLRAPLRAMSGFAQALVEDFAGQLGGEARTYLEQIALASRRMGELIDGLLTLSRSTRGGMNHDLIDLSGMARRLLADLARGEPDRTVAWEVADCLEARGDARMLEVVLSNLLGNAWKYTARTAAPRLRVYAEARGGGHWFCVADNGAGFDMAHAARLFQPFQRLHRQEEFPGMGIGLATVQRIVHRHGGRIEAHGEPGRGAVFSFTLGEAPGEAA